MAQWSLWLVVYDSEGRLLDVSPGTFDPAAFAGTANAAASCTRLSINNHDVI